MPIKRRAVLLGGMGVGLAPALTTSEATRSTASDRVAIRVFPTFRDVVYSNHDAVLSRLGVLGIKRMSHRLTPYMPAEAIEFTQRARSTTTTSSRG